MAAIQQDPSLDFGATGNDSFYFDIPQGCDLVILTTCKTPYGSEFATYDVFLARGREASPTDFDWKNVRFHEDGSQSFFAQTAEGQFSRRIIIARDLADNQDLSGRWYVNIVRHSGDFINHLRLYVETYSAGQSQLIASENNSADLAVNNRFALYDARNGSQVIGCTIPLRVPAKCYGFDIKSKPEAIVGVTPDNPTTPDWYRQTKYKYVITSGMPVAVPGAIEPFINVGWYNEYGHLLTAYLAGSVSILVVSDETITRLVGSTGSREVYPAIPRLLSVRNEDPDERQYYLMVIPDQNTALNSHLELKVQVEAVVPLYLPLEYFYAGAQPITVKIGADFINEYTPSVIRVAVGKYSLQSENNISLQATVTSSNSSTARIYSGCSADSDPILYEISRPSNQGVGNVGANFGFPINADIFGNIIAAPFSSRILQGRLYVTEDNTQQYQITLNATFGSDAPPPETNPPSLLGSTGNVNDKPQSYVLGVLSATIPEVNGVPDFDQFLARQTTFGTRSLLADYFQINVDFSNVPTMESMPVLDGKVYDSGVFEEGPQCCFLIQGLPASLGNNPLLHCSSGVAYVGPFTNGLLNTNPMLNVPDFALQGRLPANSVGQTYDYQTGINERGWYRSGQLLGDSPVAGLLSDSNADGLLVWVKAADVRNATLTFVVEDGVDLSNVESGLVITPIHFKPL